MRTLKQVVLKRDKRKAAAAVQGSESSSTRDSPTVATATASAAILKEIGEMTTHVPFIKGAAGILLRIMTISDELQLYRTQWREVVDDFVELSKALKDVSEYGKSHAWIFPPDLKQVLEQWEQELKDILAVLRQYEYETKSRWNRVSLILSRTSASDKIASCDAKAKRLLQTYHTSILITIKSNQDVLAQTRLPVHRVNPKLPLGAPIFCGRDEQLGLLLEILDNGATFSAQIAILGPEGIGKTSLSLAVLHNPTVIRVFDERIYFIPCTGCFSLSMLLIEMAIALGIQQPSVLVSLEDQVLDHLDALSSLIYLDSIDTLCGSDPDVRISFEHFLSRIAQKPNISLVVSQSGPNLPSKLSWSIKLVLEPFVSDTIEQAFHLACGKPDKWAKKLIGAMEGLPLAIIMAAQLAKQQNSKIVWEQFHSDMLTNAVDSTLTSPEFLIQMLIDHVKLESGPSAIFPLRLLTKLPGGISLNKIVSLQYLFPEYADMSSSIVHLQRSGLAALTDEHLHVHSLVLKYLEHHMPLSEEHILLLEQYYLEFILQEKNARSNDLVKDCKNIDTILLHSLGHNRPTNQVIKAVSYYSSIVASKFGSFTEELFLQLDARVDTLEPNQISIYLMQWGSCLAQIRKEPEAKAKFELALKYSHIHELKQVEADTFQKLGDLEYQMATDSTSLATGSTTLAIEFLTQALSLHVMLRDASGQAHDLCQLSHLALERPRSTQNAREFAQRAIKLYGSTNSAQGLGNAWTCLGDGLYFESYYEEAKEYYEKALGMFRKIGSVSSEATALQLLGKTYLAEKKYSTAKDHLSQALTIRRQENSLASHISNLTLLGEVHLYLKESEISLEFYKQALNFYEIKRDQVRQGQVLVGIGRVFAQQGRYHEAINYVKRAKELHEACKGAEHEVGNDLDELGKIYHAQHDIKFAEESWRDAVEIHRMQSDTAALTQSLLSLGGLYVNEGELDAAKTHYLESLMLCEKHHITHTQIKVLRCLGDMYRRGKDNDLAIKWYKKALEVLDRVDNFEEKEYVKDALAEVQEESGTTNTTVAKVLKDGPEVRTVGSSELPDIVSS